MFGNRNTTSEPAARQLTAMGGTTLLNGTYSDRKRVWSPEDGRHDVNASTRTISGGEGMSTVRDVMRSIDMVNVFRKRGRRDIVGPKTVPVIAKNWTTPKYHERWFPGQIMFHLAIPDATDSLSRVETSIAITVDGDPLTVLSPPQIMHWLDRDPQYLVDRYLPRLDEGDAPLSVLEIIDKVRYAGICSNVEPLGRELTRIEMAVAGEVRCQNYWGDDIRPGDAVGMLFRYNPAATGVNRYVVEPWSNSDFDKPTSAAISGINPLVPASNRNREVGVWSMIGKVVKVDVLDRKGMRDMYGNTLSGSRQGRLLPFGRIGNAPVDEEMAWSNFKCMRDSVVIAIQPTRPTDAWEISTTV